jgi:NhaP-type Na+/H+ or K+/H+ antiporter
VSVAVGVVLFEAGLRLSLRELEASARSVVVSVVLVGVLVTWAGVALTVAVLFDGLMHPGARPGDTVIALEDPAGGA